MELGDANVRRELTMSGERIVKLVNRHAELH
jgi:hypothetical protein